MERPKWPTLSHTNPKEVKEHAALLDGEFKAVQKLLSADFSDIEPGLPKGIRRKVARGIAKGLVEVENHHYSTSYISVNDRDLISDAILKKITAETAASFHSRVPQYLFNILQKSYNELNVKLATQNYAASQQGIERSATALGNEISPQTPPDSPLEDTDSKTGDFYSDTEDLADLHWRKANRRLDFQARKLKTQLQEVEDERESVTRRFEEKANKIRKALREVKLKEIAADKKHTEALAAMKKRRLEVDSMGDYNTKAVGYHVFESLNFQSSKRDGTARPGILRIENQVVVNRLFNMPAEVFLRKVTEAVVNRLLNMPVEVLPPSFREARMQEEKGGETIRLSTVVPCLGVELLDDGNVALWSHNADNYEWMKSLGNTSDGLQHMPFWDEDIFSSFARHIMERHKTYTVEMIDPTVAEDDLRDRKRKAALITDLVQHNVTAIPSLHIDIVKDVRFSRRTTDNDNSALLLDFSNPVTANEVISQGLQYRGRFCACQVLDSKFLVRCGNCQMYGHCAHVCAGPLRCGKCTEEHPTKRCPSSLTKCALCDQPHRSGSPRCLAKKERMLDQINARFPTGKDDQPFAIPPRRVKVPSPSLSSSAMSLPIRQAENLKTTKCNSDASSTIFPTALADPGTFLIQQLQSKLPGIVDALCSDMKSMGLTPPADWTTTRPDKRACRVEEEDEIL